MAGLGHQWKFVPRLSLSPSRPLQRFATTRAMACLRDSWRTNLPASQQLRNPSRVLRPESVSHPGIAQRQVLVVAPLSGGFPFLLRDLVVGLLRHAHRVAITDWPDARYVPLSHGGFGVEDSISHVASMIRALGPDLHVVAVSQGAVTALAAVALLAVEDQPLTPRSLILLGGPIDPAANPTPLVNFVRARSPQWFADNVIETVPAGYPGRGRRVFPRSNQLKMHQAYSWRSFYESGEFTWKLMYDDGEDPVRFPFSLLSSSLMDVTADFFLENLQHVFLEPALPSGTLAVHGPFVSDSEVEKVVAH